MNILTSNTLGELHNMFFTAALGETGAGELLNFNGEYKERMSFFLPSQKYGANIHINPDGGVDVRLLNEPLAGWSGRASWDLVHLTISPSGKGVRIFHGEEDGTFLVLETLDAKGLIKLLVTQYPEELHYLTKLINGSDNV